MIELAKGARVVTSAARDMEATDADLQRTFAELPGEIERARELVRLHADQRNERPATAAL